MGVLDFGDRLCHFLYHIEMLPCKTFLMVLIYFKCVLTDLLPNTGVSLRWFKEMYWSDVDVNATKGFSPMDCKLTQGSLLWERHPLSRLKNGPALLLLCQWLPDLPFSTDWKGDRKCLPFNFISLCPWPTDVSTLDYPRLPEEETLDELLTLQYLDSDRNSGETYSTVVPLVQCKAISDTLDQDRFEEPNHGSMAYGCHWDVTLLWSFFFSPFGLENGSALWWLTFRRWPYWHHWSPRIGKRTKKGPFNPHTTSRTIGSCTVRKTAIIQGIESFLQPLQYIFSTWTSVVLGFCPEGTHTLLKWTVWKPKLDDFFTIQTQMPSWF